MARKARQLPTEEYVEQAHLFRTLAERQQLSMPIQDLLADSKMELLSSTKLPLAVSILVDEVRFSGTLTPAMTKLSHYFTPFQTFLIATAEDDRARLDFNLALRILEREARYKSEDPAPQGLFLYQFEVVCRNRLGYDPALVAISGDPLYDEHWREWILSIRFQLGLVEFADLLYGRSQHFINVMRSAGRPLANPDMAILFGEKEGKIALANRDKDPLFFFAALERHLSYPAVPRPQRPEERGVNMPQLLQQVKRLEARVKLLEEEARGGIDLTKLYAPPPRPPESP